MKRFTTALAICALLIVAPGAYAVDYLWSGVVDGSWHNTNTPNNWGAAGQSFPAGPNGTPRVIDRAEFTDGSSTATIVFDGNSGAANCDCRTIIEFWMKPAAAVALTLQVTGDSLYVKQFFMESTATAATELNVTGGEVHTQFLRMIGGTSGKTATLNIDGGELHIATLDITATTSGAQAKLLLDAEVTVSGRTTIDGYVDFTNVAGVGFYTGQMIIEDDSTVTVTTAGTSVTADQLVIIGPLTSGDTTLTHAGSGVIETS